MDILRLYQDYSVSYQTEGHKHCRPGWVNTECPHCTGNPGLHLGYNLQGDYYVCWRCGFHPIAPTIAKLIHVGEPKARTIIHQYGLLIPTHTKESKVKIRAKAHRLPSNTVPLQRNHKRYLESRGFDPDLLEREWNLLGTGPYSKLDNTHYKHRIIIPFFWDTQQVSFDSRDITGKDQNRYKACPKDRELVPHKEILYGKQSKWKDTGICVEGPTDVWRLGVNSFATSGIKYTPKQVRVMAKSFKRIWVMFDDDPQALVQAKKLVSELRFRGVEAMLFESIIASDPGSMKQNDADYLIKQLIN